jgi:hypothetical protein
MAANLHVISGQLRLNQSEGRAEVDFSTGEVTGAASRLEILGQGRDFRSRPHVIVSLNETTLSTKNNTFYQLDRSVTEQRLQVEWKIDRAGGNPALDFLVIGVPQ